MGRDNCWGNRRSRGEVPTYFRCQGSTSVIGEAGFYRHQVARAVVEGAAWFEAHHLSVGVSIPTDQVVAVSDFEIGIDSPGFDPLTEVDGDVVIY